MRKSTVTDLVNVRRWPHQLRAVEAILAAIAVGVLRILLSAPPGAGKSLIICDIIKVLVDQGWYVIVYTNRRALVDQLHEVLTVAGIPHGIRAAGYESELEAAVQISSLDTERSRTIKRQRWLPHGEGQRVLAIIDEAHINATPTVKDLMDYHISRGGAALGVTGTPIDLGGFYDELIVAGLPSELRQCGALVPARHFGPTEPDWYAFKRQKKAIREGHDLSGNQARDLMNVPVIFGYISDWFEQLNPAHLPTICFAPDVDSSLWIAEQFWKRGITWAHIDSKRVWWNGKPCTRCDSSLTDLLAASGAGDLIGISNRFILREAIDMPWLRHCIVATVFGSLQSYLQSLSRVLRADKDPETIARFGPKKFSIIQDHSGGWHRHGSVNADRDWCLGDTTDSVYHIRADRLRTRKCRRCQVHLRPHDPWCPACHFFNEIEPMRCRQCGLIITCGKCAVCGWAPTGGKMSRPVIGIGGKPREMVGDIFQPHREYVRPDGAKVWERMFYRAASAKWNATFRQALCKFAEENGWAYPPRTLPLMPTKERDWFLRVQDVPVERLRGDPETLEKACHYIKCQKEKACASA